MINLVAQRALYGADWRPAPPIIRSSAQPVRASGALSWRNNTRDMSPTRLIVDMPTEETVFGKASGCTAPTTLNSQREPTRDSAEFAAWKRAMGVA